MGRFETDKRAWTLRSGFGDAGLRGLCLILLVSVTTACASAPRVLPEQSSFVETPFDDYQEALAAYNRVAVSQTTIGQLFDAGYDVGTFPNVEQLSYLDLIKRFMPHDSITFADLDPGLRDCLKARQKCHGYQINPSRIEQERVGSVALDVFNFRRTEVTKGWKAQVIFVLYDDVVVYKLWSGTQRVQETHQETNPLGPFQNLGGAFSGAVKSAF